MKVRFLQNLGSQDAKAFGLDHKKCAQDSEADVPDDVADALVKKYPCIFELKAVPPVSNVKSKSKGE